MEDFTDPQSQQRLVRASSAMAALVVLYYVLLSLYRLFLHPLARFPGPRIRAVSSIPVIWDVLTGRVGMKNKQLHDKYGAIVRASPNELLFNSVDAWEDIYGHRVGRPNMDKDIIHVGSVENIPGSVNLTMADDVTHSRQRRALSHAFSQKALFEQEPLMQAYVDKLVRHFHRFADTGETFNFVQWINYATFDIIGDLSFGEPFGCLEEGDTTEAQAWIKLIYESIRSGAIEQATRRFARTGTLTQRFLLWLIPTVVRERRRRHLRNSIEKTKRRMEKQSDHKDFLWYIMKQRERKNDVSDDEIILNAALFIIGGSETTAGLLSGMMNMLFRNPRCYDRLAAEIRSSFKSESEIHIEQLKPLVYLNACINEGLRIFPPVPVGLLRTVPPGGDKIGGEYVPGGVSVSVGSYAAAHNPQNFKDCDSFIPERWIDEEYAEDKKKASQPFSLGPRGCIGRHLTYVEVRILLARLLWNFDIKSVDGAPDWDPSGDFHKMRAYNTWQKEKLLVRLSKRKFE